MHKLRKQNLKLNKNVDFRIVNIGDNMIYINVLCNTDYPYKVHGDIKVVRMPCHPFLFVYYVCKNIMLFMPLFKIRICWRFGRYSFHTY